MSLVSRNMGYSRGFLGTGASSNNSGVGNFRRFWWLLLRRL